jgi:hypothetical protein
MIKGSSMNDSKMTKAEAGRLGALKRAENNRKKYNKNPKLCKFCSEIIPYEKRHQKIFCDQSCSAKFNNTLRKIDSNVSDNEVKLIRDKIKIEKEKKNICMQCGIFCFNKYCSVKCQQKFKYDLKIKLWKDGKLKISEILNTNGQIKPIFRKYLLEKYGEKCTKCGWDEKNIITNKCPIEVEHIDGNSNNNTEDNLTLLCPNCHALTSTYKSLNKGHGRNQRMSRYREGKTF